MKPTQSEGILHLNLHSLRGLLILFKYLCQACFVLTSCFGLGKEETSNFKYGSPETSKHGKNEESS
jgi:hypothetical protein